MIPAGLRAALLAVLVAAAPAAEPAPRETASSQRRPLAPHHPRLEAKGKGSSVVTSAEGDYVFRYPDEGRQVEVVIAPPNKLELVVAAAVEATGEGQFTYSYELAVAGSRQPAAAFQVETTGKETATDSPAGWESRPIEFQPMIAWSPRDPASGLAAGGRLGGFAFRAQAAESLPGIVECHAQSPAEIPTFAVEPPAELGEILPRYPEDGVGGLTVGPVALPPEGDWIPWLVERLQKYVGASRRQGWITDGGAAASYKERMSRLGRLIQGREREKTKGELASLESQVAADPALTSEAKALFLHNGRFLAQLLDDPEALVLKGKPLVPVTPKINVKTPEFAVATNADGDFEIRYRGEEGPVHLVFVQPNHLRLTVSAKVEATADGNFIYRYQLVNAASSRQSARLLRVRSQGKVLEVEAPEHWTGELGSRGEDVWWSGKATEYDEGPSLLPGGRLGGLAFEAEGTLPGIVDCRARGRVPIGGYPDEPPGGLEDVLPDYLEEGVGGHTVGPVVPPREGWLPGLAKRLQDYVGQSRHQGWLASDKLAERYHDLLAEVANKPDAQPLDKAELLGRFRRQVEQDFRQGGLTTEAYALLVHNSRFLEKLLMEKGSR